MFICCIPKTEHIRKETKNMATKKELKADLAALQVLYDSLWESYSTVWKDYMEVSDELCEALCKIDELKKENEELREENEDLRHIVIIRDENGRFMGYIRKITNTEDSNGKSI